MKATDRPKLHIDSDRLRSSLMELAQIGGTRRAPIALINSARQGCLPCFP
jgi:hypothetical protein